jgi:hypothetical protein
MNYRFTPVAFIALALSACAAPAKVENMVTTAGAAPAPANAAITEAICVTKVTGGQETNPMWTSEVDDAGFRAALEGSLRNNRLAAANAAGCRYDLGANVLGLAQPAFGFDLLVTSHVNYSLLEHGSGNPYFLTTITAPYTATVNDAFAAVTRLRLANEGSIRTNIQMFLDELLAHDPT